jgi:hypothetical protein
MPRLILLIVPLFLSAAIILGFRFISSQQVEFAALQVTSTPQAEVFLDKVTLGKTPLYNDKLKPGEHALSLVPQGSSGLVSFEQKVILRNSILTVIDRIFKATETQSETSIISLEAINGKGAEIAVVSSPDSAEVNLDEQPQGITPLLLKEVSVSDHQISVAKEGYNAKTLRLHTAEGFRLTASVKLSIAQEVEATPSATPGKEASKSATVRILETPTGFLRVRQEPSTSSPEVARVNPSDTFSLVDKTDTWYKIKLPDGKEGWVSSQYATLGE